MAGIGDAFVEVRADTKQFSKDLDKGVTQATQGATKQMGGLEKATAKVGSVAKLAIAGLAVGALSKLGDFAQDAVRAYSDLNESLNAVEVTFGDASDEIKTLGRQSAQSLGLSNAEFNTLAVQMSAFAQTIAGDGGDVAGTIDELTTRVSDFASVMNLDVAEAARLFQSGLAGETEPLRKYGIDLSAAAVQAHALAVGIAEGNDPLSEQEKVLSRHSLLLEQTDKTAGDFANTSGELANATRIMNAEIENSKALVGRALKGAFESALPVVSGFWRLLSDVSIGFLELTGQMDRAEAGFLTLQQTVGATGVAMEDILGLALKEFRGLWAENTDAASDYGAVIGEQLDQWAVGKDLALEWRDGLDLIAQQLGLTTEQEELARDALDTYIISQDRAAADAGKHRGAFSELGSGIKEVADNADVATTALQRYEDEVRSQTDPLYALLTANRDVADAELAVTAAANEFTTDSSQYRQALVDLSIENQNLVAAQLAVADQSDLTRQEFATMLLNMGNLTTAQVEIILSEFDRVNAFNFKDHLVTVNGRVVGFGLPRITGHDGLVVPGSPGQEVPVLAMAGETILPTHKPGVTAGGMSANITVNLSGSASRADGMMVGVEVERALRRLAESRTVA